MTRKQRDPMTSEQIRNQLVAIDNQVRYYADTTINWEKKHITEEERLRQLDHWTNVQTTFKKKIWKLDTRRNNHENTTKK
jgi:hypothetical protein